MNSDEKREMMELCLKMASENVNKNGGGPFAALVVRDGKIIGKGTNSVARKSDPTAHAEIEAIRDACDHVGDHHLTDTVIFSSCEPCPMCLGAIYWSGIREVFYAADRYDAELAGFGDAFIYREFAEEPGRRKILFEKIESPTRLIPFKLWEEHPDKIDY